MPQGEGDAMMEGGWHEGRGDDMREGGCHKGRVLP